jgi:hypothetical protein
MLIALADENAGKEESVEVQVDVIRVARKYLREHPEACKVVSLVRQEKPKNLGGRPHEHGSEPCLLAFLGDINWNSQKIHSLLSIADRFDDSLLKEVSSAPTHPERKGTIGLLAGVEIAKLEKTTQRVAHRRCYSAHLLTADRLLFLDTQRYREFCP